MGHVYKARDTRLHRFVAIKALAFGKLADDDLRLRFLQEARAASALNHPNIITIHDILSVDGADFLVMEYVPGKTLADLIPKGGMSAREVLDYGTQMANALAAAHKAGVVHRDIKPGNIMVSETGTVKVLDFGLAKQIDSSHRMELTAEGAILGTAAYMAPEQAEGKKASPRSDIFSFGAILHEMITGRQAFSGESHASILDAVRRDPPRRLSELVADVPAGLEELVAKCLDKNPETRWGNTDDLHAALSALKGRQDTGISAPPPPAPAPVSAAPPPDRTLLIVAAALLLALIAGAVWWKTSKPEPRVDPIMIPPVSRETDRPSPVAPLTPLPEPAAPAPGAPAQPAVPGTEGPKAAAKPVTLPDGYPIPLLLETPVTKGLDDGASLRLTAASDIAIEGVRLVAKGAQAAGFVGQGKKKFLRGRSVMIGFQAVRAVDGTPVRLRATSEAGKEPLRGAEVSGSKSGDAILATSGTSYLAYVDGKVEIVPKR